MEFRELKSLVVLAESGSLSETARLLNLSPAAIHKQLKHLELDLQVPLYERKDGRLRLTPAADLVLPYLRDILGQHKSAVCALDEWRGVRRGLIRIGAGPSLATYVLPAVMADFLERFPGIDLDIQTGATSQLTDSLRTGHLDLALVVAPETTEEQSFETVVEYVSELVPISALKGAPGRGSLSALLKFPFVLFRKGSRIENLIDRYWTAQRAAPNVVVRADSAEVVKAMLIRGMGVSMLPDYTVQEDIRAGRLKRFRQREPPLLMTVHLLARKSQYVPPAVKEFIARARAILTSARR